MSKRHEMRSERTERIGGWGKGLFRAQRTAQGKDPGKAKGQGTMKNGHENRRTTAAQVLPVALKDILWWTAASTGFKGTPSQIPNFHTHIFRKLLLNTYLALRTERQITLRQPHSPVGKWDVSTSNYNSVKYNRWRHRLVAQQIFPSDLRHF